MTVPLALALVMLLFSVAWTDEKPDILERIDGYRIPRNNARAEVQLDVRIQELDLLVPVIKQTHSYTVYLNTQRDSVVEMLSPDERGRRVLMTDEAVWLHIPTASRPIRITPLQRLLGQANYGDVGRIAWHGAYQIKQVSDETGIKQPSLVAAERLLGIRFPNASNLPLRHLVLEAASATATYPRIDVWVRAEDLAPIRADYFLTSGKILKTGWFSAPEQTNEGMLVRTIAFVDDKSATNVTTLTTESTHAKELPKAFFTVRGFTKNQLH